MKSDFLQLYFQSSFDNQQKTLFEALGSPIKQKRKASNIAEQLNFNLTTMTPSTRKSEEDNSISSFDGNVVKVPCEVPEEITKRLLNAKSKAKPPVSNFHVGCLVETTDGNFHEGFNVEFLDSRHHTIHAEQAALSQVLQNK